MPGESWAPGLADVGRHIPTRTRDARTPGSDTMLGTFTADTTPTDAQAQAVIDDAVAVLVADVGALDAAAPEIRTAARSAAEWQAAADIELAYPNRDADIHVADQLTIRAQLALTNLKRVMAQAGTGTVDVTPEWQMPLPPPWGDSSPGSGTDYQMGPY